MPEKLDYTPGMPMMSLMAGDARGRKYTTNTPVKAVRSPVN